MKPSFYEFFKPTAALVFVVAALVIPGVASAALIDEAGALWGRADLTGADSSQFFSPHHATLGASHNEHYFSRTGDGDHFAWSNATPSTSGMITIKYDFRPQNSYANLITDNQKAAAIEAFNAWSFGTNGKIQFIQDAAASRADIINVGTGDLAAVGPGYVSGPGDVLAVGGGSYLHYNALGLHDIGDAAAWQDMDEAWDTTRNNGDPAGTYDYFTVVAQEIGHTLGLGHASGADNIMNSTYTNELIALSLVDVEHIQSVYGNYSPLPSVPLPAPIWLLGSGLLMLFALGRQRQFRDVRQQRDSCRV